MSGELDIFDLDADTKIITTIREIRRVYHDGCVNVIISIYATIMIYPSYFSYCRDGCVDGNNDVYEGDILIRGDIVIQ